MTAIRKSPSGPLVDVNTPNEITQTAFYIDSVNGNDENDGSSPEEALQTLNGFSALVGNAFFTAPTTVFVSGDHHDGFLYGNWIMDTDATVTFLGQSAVVVDTDTITTYTDVTGAGNEAPLIEVAAKDWSALIGKRIRITSGAAIGFTAWIAVADPDGAGADVVRICQFFEDVFPPSGNVPTGGDTFVVEDLTEFGSVRLDISGNPLLFQDLHFAIPAPGFLNAFTVKGSYGIAGCYIESELTGPGDAFISGSRAGRTRIGGGSLNLNFQFGLFLTEITATQEVASGFSMGSFIFQNSIAQNTAFRFECNMEMGNSGFFDNQGPMVLSGYVLTMRGFFADRLYGSGLLSGSGVNLNAFAGMTYDIVPITQDPPFITGPVSDVLIGSATSTWAGAVAASPDRNAGYFQRTP